MSEYECGVCMCVCACVCVRECVVHIHDEEGFEIGVIVYGGQRLRHLHQLSQESMLLTCVGLAR